jgi:hypothetical protein
MAKRRIFVIDGDDVIINSGEIKLQYLRNHFSDADLKDAKKVSDITLHNCNKTVLAKLIGLDAYAKVSQFAYSKENTLFAKSITGSLDAIKLLASIGDVYVLSARNPDLLENMKGWLQINNMSGYIKDIFSSKDNRFQNIAPIYDSKKVGIAVHLGADTLVDDDKRHMPLQPVDNLHCILFGPHNLKNIASHITIAEDWQQIVQLITNFHDLK